CRPHYKGRREPPTHAALLFEHEDESISISGGRPREEDNALAPDSDSWIHECAAPGDGQRAPRGSELGTQPEVPFDPTTRRTTIRFHPTFSNCHRSSVAETNGNQQGL